MAAWKGLTFVTLLALTGSPAAARDVKVLKPASPWTLDYSRDSCTLVRQFGAGDETVFLKLEQFQPGPVFDLTLIGDAFRSEQLANPLRLAFGPNRPPHLVKLALSGTGRTSAGKTLHMLFAGAQTLGGPPVPDDREQPPLAVDERTISEISLDQTRGPDMTLQFGPIDKPMEQMRLCLDHLLTRWGLDAAKQRTLSRPARPRDNPASWIRSGDYPGSELGKGRSAQVHFRLTVDENGSVSGCAIQRATKGDAFAARTCDVLRQRGRFDPALDAGGKPVASYYVNAVRWLAAEPK